MIGHVLVKQDQARARNNRAGEGEPRLAFVAAGSDVQEDCAGDDNEQGPQRAAQVETEPLVRQKQDADADQKIADTRIWAAAVARVEEVIELVHEVDPAC